MSWSKKVKKSASNAEVPQQENPFTTEPVVADVAPEKQTTRVWSDEQNRIFSFDILADGNLVIVARAGTGKTTTIVEKVLRYKQANPSHAVAVCAFNKPIQEELQSRFVGTGVTAKTFHALGNSVVQQYWSDARVPKDIGKRADDLTARVTDRNTPDTIKRIISKLHTKGREMVPFATLGYHLEPLLDQFGDLVPDSYWEAQGFGVSFVLGAAVKAMEIAATERTKHIDFADMIFLPVRNHHWANPQFDLVVVDEAQDMNVAKLLLAQAVCKGNMIIVGDNKQAIYGFCGADSHSLGRLKGELKATELTLTTTYRCGRAIVAEAQRLVPDFKAGPNNSEGLISTVAKDKLKEVVKPGDFILSRLNAPLVGVAMTLLRSNIRARVLGKDFGKEITNLVTSIGRSARSVPEFLGKLQGWFEKQTERARRLKQVNRLDQIADQYETLVQLSSNAANIDAIHARIEYLFADEQSAGVGFVTLSSIHKAKGKEADRVFVLQSTLREGKSEEEDNLVYVAITRARHELTWVV